MSLLSVEEVEQWCCGGRVREKLLGEDFLRISPSRTITLSAMASVVKGGGAQRVNQSQHQVRETKQRNGLLAQQSCRI